MTWIRTVPFSEATGRLRRLYDRIVAPDGSVDNIMMAHSLRPHSMEGHMALYKNVLHHSGNQLPKWFLETIGVYVSLLNECGYCADHHAAGLARLLGDRERADRIRAALESGTFKGVLADDEVVALGYARALTLDPAGVSTSLIEELRAVGYDDGRILEINQVTAYFAYANRTVLGLGCNYRGRCAGPVARGVG